MAELPSMLSCSYTSNSITPDMLRSVGAVQVQSSLHLPAEKRKKVAYAELHTEPHTEEINQMTTIRIVKVIIADPNDNLPLNSRVLHNGAEQLTDLTDQELFFEISIAELLKAHNEVRAKTLDKKASEKFGRDIYMEPARIRDLKMVVVNVAQF